MKTLSHHCNQEKRLSYCERSPPPPIWVDLRTLCLPAGKRITFVRRNHGLDSKTSTQDGVSRVSGISSRVPETLEPRTQAGTAVKGSSKVTSTCHNGTQVPPTGTQGDFPLPLPPWFAVQPAPALGRDWLLNQDTHLTLPWVQQRMKKGFLTFNGIIEYL